MGELRDFITDVIHNGVYDLAKFGVVVIFFKVQDLAPLVIVAIALATCACVRVYGIVTVRVERRRWRRPTPRTRRFDELLRETLDRRDQNGGS